LNLKRLFVWLTLFSIAMGFLETAVVVYLRALYYPEGFHLPLVNLDASIATTELGREAATIIMLVGIGIVAGKNPTQRFAWFLYCFAIWDIFYYVFLKVLLNWPESLFTWDILFLIPLPWFGPILCPIIISTSMILLASFLIYFNEKKSSLKINAKEWMLFISGSLVVILSFVIDCYNFIRSYTHFSQGRRAGDEVMEAVSRYVPDHFDWWIFWTGETLILGAISMFLFRAKSVLSGAK
jgi:hypothetical protein